jgi:DNA-binding NarL/FixJ family response regulator
MIKVLLAGERSIPLHGVKQVLAETVDIVPVLEARTGPETLEKIRAHPLVDAVVVVQPEHNARLCDMLDGIALVRPGLPVLMLGDPEQMGSPYRSTATVWLPENCSAEELVMEIRMAVLQAQASVPNGWAQAMAPMISGGHHERRQVNEEDR